MTAKPYRAHPVKILSRTRGIYERELKMKGKKIIALILLGVLVLLAACGDGSTQNPPTAAAQTQTTKPAAAQATQAANPTATAAAPESALQTEIDMTLWYRGAEATVMPTAGDLMAKRVKEEFNVNFTIEFIDKGAVNEKLNVMFASGQYPDIVCGMYDFTQVVDAVENGVLLPITEYLASDPNWSAVPDHAFALTTINGERYSVPHMIDFPNGIFYREDWLKKLGRTEPTNFDEYTDLLRAFTNDDPDGNGVKDTYGFGFGSGFGFTGTIQCHFLPYGIGAFYLDNADDTIKNIAYLAEDNKALLTWLRTMHEEGVLDPEWVVAKDADAEAKFTSGIYGTYARGVGAIMNYYNRLQAAIPEAVVTVLPVLAGKYGSNMTMGDDINSGYYLTSACKDPVRGAQVFGFFWGPEGHEIMQYGEEGKTFKIENGTFTWLMEDAKTLYNPGVIVRAPFDIPLKTDEPELEAAIAKTKPDFATTDNSTITRLTPLSEAYKLKSADISKMTLEFFTRVIIGEKTLNDYDAYLADLKSAGVDEILAELNDLYHANPR